MFAFGCVEGVASAVRKFHRQGSDPSQSTILDDRNLVLVVGDIISAENEHDAISDSRTGLISASLKLEHEFNVGHISLNFHYKPEKAVLVTESVEHKRQMSFMVINNGDCGVLLGFLFTLVRFARTIISINDFQFNVGKNCLN